MEDSNHEKLSLGRISNSLSNFSVKHASHNESFNQVNNVSFLIFIWFLDLCLFNSIYSNSRRMRRQLEANKVVAAANA